MENFIPNVCQLQKSRLLWLLCQNMFDAKDGVKADLNVLSVVVVPGAVLSLYHNPPDKSQILNCTGSSKLVP